MKLRAAEILFRHKLLICLPLLFVVVGTTALALRPKAQQWQSFAAIWVNPYKPLTPDSPTSSASGQAGLINDFIHTRTFALSVLGQTSLAPLLKDPRNQLTLMSQFQHWTSTDSNGSFVTIVATTPSSDLSYALVQGVLSSFQDILQGQTQSQTQAALTAYGSSLQDARAALAKSQSDLVSYVSAHPELFPSGGSVDSRAIALDPIYASFINQVANDQASVNALQQQVASVQQSATAGREGLPFTFTLVDEPQPAPGPVRTSRLNLIKLPAIGLIVGSLLSAGLAALLIMSNRSVLGTPDLSSSLGVLILGELRTIPRTRWPWHRMPSGVAGSRLPWRRNPAQLVRRTLASAAAVQPLELQSP